MASDVSQLMDAFKGINDIGTIYFAPQIAAPTLSPTLALATGTSLGVGTYIYRFTWVTGYKKSNGTLLYNTETTASSPFTITTTSGNQAVTFSALPTTWPATALGLRVYRTAVGGADLSQKFAYTITTPMSSWTDTIADASLSTTALPTTNTTGSYLGGPFLNAPTATATASANYGSTQWKFQRSTWNGSAAVTASSQWQLDSSGNMGWYNESSTRVFSISQTGAIAIPNGVGLTSAAGTTFKTGPAGLGWIAQTSSATATPFAVENSAGAILFQTGTGSSSAGAITKNNTLDDGVTGAATFVGTLTAPSGVFTSSATIAGNPAVATSTGANVEQTMVTGFSSLTANVQTSLNITFPHAFPTSGEFIWVSEEHTGTGDVAIIQYQFSNMTATGGTIYATSNITISSPPVLFLLIKGS